MILTNSSSNIDLCALTIDSWRSESKFWDVYIHRFMCLYTRFTCPYIRFAVRRVEILRLDKGHELNESSEYHKWSSRYSCALQLGSWRGESKFEFDRGHELDESSEYHEWSNRHSCALKPGSWHGESKFDRGHELDESSECHELNECSNANSCALKLGSWRGESKFWNSTERLFPLLQKVVAKNSRCDQLDDYMPNPSPTS